jgi:CubicO group peptidase (beta-lactamase class C family)
VTFAAAGELLARAVETRATPAAAVEVGRAAAPIWTGAFGHLSYDSHAPAATPETVFDLASLTKVIATTSLTMRAVEEGRLAADQPVAALLDGWGDDAHADIRIRHLLDHSSGLPARARLWESARGAVEFAQAIHALPLEHAPGHRSVYSDLGFIVLGFVLERLAGTPLDVQYAALQRDAWSGSMAFNPAIDPVRVAPTEIDDVLRGPLRGIVHDENARALAGVAGHAGLFGTVADVGRFARMTLKSFRESTPLGSPAAMRTFARETGVAGSSRALGWDIMRPTSSCGRRFSPAAIGHTGFTGTSLWIDPERDIYVALLTNRIHPTRSNEAWLTFRPRIHDAILQELGA